MQKIVTFVVSCILFFQKPSSAQCPDKDLLRERLINLRNANLPPRAQLDELLPTLDSIHVCSDKIDSTHVSLIRRIAGNYLKLADYIKAAHYYREIIKIISDRPGNPALNQLELLTSYHFLTEIYSDTSLNNTVERMKAADSCISIAMRLKVPSDISCVRSLYAKTKYFFDVGDYRNSIDYATRCEKFAWEYANRTTNKRYSAIGKAHAESSLLWRVKALLILNEYETAEKILINKADEYKKAGLDNYLSTTLGQLAEVQLHKGNYEKALFFFNQALKYDQRAGYNFRCKQTLKEIGFYIYFSHFNDSEKALVYYRKALAYINNDKNLNITDVFESLSIFANIGNVYVQKGLYDSAFYYFQLAFDQIKQGTSEENILQSSQEEFMKHKKIYYLTSLVIDKGDAFRKQYEYSRQSNTIQKAVEIYKQADKLLNRVKAEQTDLESKLFWRSDTRRLYENAIEACYLSGNANDAFYFFERSRAVLLNDQLNEQHWLDEKSIMKRTQVNKRILQIKRDMAIISRSSDRYKELQSDLDENEFESDRLLSSIQQKNPLYYQSFLDSTDISISDVRQKILKERQALVELFNSNKGIYILVVTPDKIQLKKISKSDFDRLSNSFLHYISDYNALNRDYPAFVSSSRELYNLIFQDISLPPGRIIISPDGNYFPFEALVISNFAKPIKYFTEDYAVSYTFSARFLLNDFNFNNHQRSHDFIGIAPVEYRGEFALAALPGSEHSLKKLQTYFRDGIGFISTQATRNNFLSNYYHYKILQLYTHATDSGHNSEPVIFFADSMLLLSDLMYETEPSTKLVVLSACETGKGKLFQGEGVFSFSRGFAALGIPSSITTLWSVDNKSTYQITELFYKYLAQGAPIDIALQKAKLEFISDSKENQLPYYWAAPILAGQSNPIDVRKPIAWNYIALASIALIAIVGIGIWKTTRKALTPIPDTMETAA